MPFTCRRPEAFKEPWERDTSEAAEPAHQRQTYVKCDSLA